MSLPLLAHVVDKQSSKWSGVDSAVILSCSFLYPALTVICEYTPQCFSDVICLAILGDPDLRHVGAHVCSKWIKGGWLGDMVMLPACWHGDRVPVWQVRPSCRVSGETAPNFSSLKLSRNWLFGIISEFLRLDGGHLGWILALLLCLGQEGSCVSARSVAPQWVQMLLWHPDRHLRGDRLIYS